MTFKLNRTLNDNETRHADDLGLSAEEYRAAIEARPINVIKGAWGIQIECDGTGDDDRPWATSVWIYRKRDGQGGSLEAGETLDGDIFPDSVVEAAEARLYASPLGNLY